MYVDTLHLRDERPLQNVANEIFPLFQIKNFEKKESSFYPTGQYFVGRDKAFDLRISVEDDIGFEDYNYCLVFGFVDKAQRTLNEPLKVLLANNCQVCRSRGDDRNPGREVYTLSPEKQIVSKLESLKR
jgi:hypothetical protein